MAPATTGRPSNLGRDGLLLSLPRSDLVMKVGKNGKTFSSTQARTTSAVKRADLVLFQLATNCALDDDLLAGRCHILANDRSATLVTPTTSVGLVTVGTSNALVVWKESQHQKEEQDADDGGRDGATSPSTADANDDKNNNNNITLGHKRWKATTPCRLIQPGGSGASFLVGQPHEPDPQDVLRFFLQAGRNGNNGTGVTFSTSTLANLFQCSEYQIRCMLRERLATVVAMQGCVPYRGTADDDDSVITEDYWQLVTEHEVLLGQQALVQTLCEDDALDSQSGENGGSAGTLASLTLRVSERLFPLLLDEGGVRNTDTYTTATASTSNQDDLKERRSLAIAQKTILLAQKKAKIKTGDKPRRLRYTSRIIVDPQKIAFYALRDLYLDRPSYGQSDLMGKWAARLPLGDEYEQCVSMEWLYEGGWMGRIPTTCHGGKGTIPPTENAMQGQLVLELVSGDDNGPVLKLTAPDTVLQWRDMVE